MVEHVKGSSWRENLERAASLILAHNNDDRLPYALSEACPKFTARIDLSGAEIRRAQHERVDRETMVAAVMVMVAVGGEEDTTAIAFWK
jgi:hypothetical protein